MSVIHFIHPDKLFADFIKDYLEVQGFDSYISYTNVEGFTDTLKTEPALIILNKESPYLDAKGFLIKKRYADKIKNIPVFLVGDFSPLEIQEFKKDNVRAFLTKKLNPLALLERIYHELNIPLPAPEKKTPMLMDLHAKGRVIIAQLEGNLEPDKLVFFNYLIRMFCKSKEIKNPRLLLIIPSLYPETITRENIEILFSFRYFKELEIDIEKILILTRIKEILALLDEFEDLREITRVNSYYEGYRKLQADIDIETKIPVEFIKKGYQYYLDLYDMKGDLVIPAMTEVTDSFLEGLKSRKINTLKYYGQIDFENMEASDGIFQTGSIMHYISTEFEEIRAELFDIDIFHDKQNLFFSQVKGQNILFISPETGIRDVTEQALGSYFNFEACMDGKEIVKKLDERRYGIVFIDLRFPPETILKLLHMIRNNATRRKTSIILLATKVNKVELLMYRKYGTDHIILAPFTTDKIYNKVFDAVSIDRQL